MSTEPPETTAFWRGDAVEDLLRRDAERRQLGVAELDEDLLGPLAEDVDLVDVGYAKQALADVLGGAFELRRAQRRRPSACRATE